jgi:glycosyltransferase involved in cell wall biosynthesis
MKLSNTFEAQISVLTGGKDLHYSFGLVSALAASNIKIDLIGGEDFESLEWPPEVRFLNLRGDQRGNAPVLQKMSRVLAYYSRLVAYAARSRTELFHILWNNKFEFFDRTCLMFFYKLLGKKIALTAHNVNAGERDGCDSLINRLSLRIQYRLCDRIFVHTNKMKSELISDFGVSEDKIVLIPFGINNAVPHSALTKAQARERLGLAPNHKVILFFGSLAPYKGLHYLVDAFETVGKQEPLAQLVIAGAPKGPPEYWKQIQADLQGKPWLNRVIQKVDFIPDHDIEFYFKAADVLVMPYVHIFQSGILFLAYSFGLPVVAADVGSLKEEVVEGVTGFICPPQNPTALADCIRKYFQSSLYRELEARRPEIKLFAGEKHSWNQIANITNSAYSQIMHKKTPGLSKVEKNHENALSLDTHPGLQR